MIADAQIEALEHVLRELLREHRVLIGLAETHRDALRRADGVVITDVSLRRDAVNARILALQDERVEITGAIARSLGTDSKKTTIRTLIQALAPARSATLVRLADELRDALEATRREHSTLRDATAMFAGHLEGVLSRAIEMCAPARTYTSAGRMSVSSSLPGALDVRH